VRVLGEEGEGGVSVIEVLFWGCVAIAYIGGMVSNERRQHLAHEAAVFALIAIAIAIWVKH
jgi:hypothetical protein